MNRHYRCHNRILYSQKKNKKISQYLELESVNVIFFYQTFRPICLTAFP